MPDVRIRNDTDLTLNIGWWALGFPAHFRNALGPGETWETHVAGWWLTLDARLDDGGSTRFIPDAWVGTLGTLGAAVGSGTASVLVGTAGAVGVVAGGRKNYPAAAAAFGVAGHLMRNANECGKTYATEADGLILRVKGLMTFGIAPLHFAVRQEDGFQLFDEKKKTDLCMRILIAAGTQV